MQDPKPAPSHEFVFKIILIGSSAAGKSTLLHYFIKKQSKKNINQTVGVEFMSKNIEVDGKIIKLQIWDTAGQEKFRSIAKTYFKQTIGALVVYDLTNEKSFEEVSDWIQDARDNGRENLDIIIVGNKVDKEDLRQVARKRGEELAREKDAAFEETSALTGDNVEEAFLRLIKQILEKVRKGSIDPDEFNPKLKQPLITKQSNTTKTQPRGCDGYC